MKDIQPTMDEVWSALRRIVRVMDLYSRQMVQRFGLTYPQLVILQEIQRRQEATPGELARAALISNATVTGIVDRLMSSGLVLRRRSHSDRRKVKLTITPEARDLLAASPPLFEKQFVDHFAGLADWERTLLVSSLQRLAGMMESGLVPRRPGELSKEGEGNSMTHILEAVAEIDGVQMEEEPDTERRT